MEQLDLFIPRRREPQARQTIQERFDSFHRLNPGVYRELKVLAMKAKRLGRERYGIGGLFEVLRWSYLLTRGDDFKLNNDFRSRYARLLMANEPELEGFFEVREIKA